ncbi:MAG: hypothetical protein R3F11_30550 [Verrucomicrobiales bacterium]
MAEISRLYYALGGGLGHAARAAAAAHTLAWRGPVTVLASHPAAPQLPAPENVAWRIVPPEISRDARAIRGWVQAEVNAARPDQFAIDCFPAGILGELSPDLFGGECVHVCRRLRWENYRPLLGTSAPPIRFSKAYACEELHPGQHEYLAGVSAAIEPLALVDPPRAAGGPRALPEGAWLVVHAGSGEEIARLEAYARKLMALEGCPGAPLVIAAPAGESPALADAAPLFPLAARIVCAAGFNTMRQTEAFAAQRRVLPMERRFDDQFWRAARCRDLP